MAEKTVVESDATTDTESGSEESKITVDRTAEEYAKRLVEISAENKKFRETNKSLKAQMDEIQGKLKTITEEQLKAQGNYQEAFTKTKAELETEREARKRDRGAYAFKVVSSQLETEAAKAGCLNPQALVKIASAEGLINDLEVNEAFEVDQQSLKTAIEKAQKEHHYLFGKQTPSVKDGVPTGTTSKTTTKNDLSSMPMEKLLEMAKRMQ